MQEVNHETIREYAHRQGLTMNIDGRNLQATENELAEGPITVGLSAHTALLDELNMVIDRLSTRLNPILSIPEPMLTEHKELLDGPHAPLANTLARHNEQLTSSINWLRDLASRVEL